MSFYKVFVCYKDVYTGLNLPKMVLGEVVFILAAVGVMH